MTTFGVLGDIDASPKLVRAALNDFLEAEIERDEEMALIIGVRRALPVHVAIVSWAERNDVPVEVWSDHEYDGAKTKTSKRFLLDIVEQTYDRSGHDGKILALVGDQTPRTDVLRALAKAKDNSMEIRDLAEAGLTYIRFQGDPPPPDTHDSEEETTMAEENVVTLTELGEYADDDSDESTQAEAVAMLTDLAGENDLDPNDYATWAELAEALGELGVGGDEEPQEDDEDDSGSSSLTVEDLKDKSIPELKKLAKAAGIDGAATMRRPDLVKALTGQTSGAAESPPTPIGSARSAAKKAAAKAPKPEQLPVSNGSVAANGELIDALVEALVPRLVVAMGQALASAT